MGEHITNWRDPFKGVRPMLNENDIMPFGKYKSKTLAWIADFDPEYIVWAAENVHQIRIDKSLVQACEMEVEEQKREREMEDPKW